MINFYDLEFKRVVLHQIVAKSDGMEHATVVPDENLFELSEDVENVIKERLAKSASKVTKAFEPEILDYHGGTFFGFCETLKEKGNSNFLATSVDIAMLLARAQTKNNIPGGSFIFIEAISKSFKTCYIAIKAEWNTALRYEIHNRQSQIKLLDDIFLDSSSKNFKVGAIFEKDESGFEVPYPNSLFGAYFYDEQFTIDSKPAEYFYQDFLGFTLESLPKIQSMKFYNNTDNYIRTFVESHDEKDNLLLALKQEFLSNEEPNISPMEFAEMYFHEPDMKDTYLNEVASYLPKTITKDPLLIKSKLDKKKIEFPNNIALSGPQKTFDFSVQIINSKDEIDDINFEDDVTILKIKGKPYRK
ncbi:MAG: nucleoid-associated protein [Candidatus Kapabacteria bacterium]|nr:nucleoid-associated protein [Ignavibacteriota bacterium]MCW5884269.1 nucleoid-associated protein [Candidatus Kapabacteria bacterium]